MTETTCHFCNKSTDGWVYPYKVFQSTLGIISFGWIDYAFGFKCAQCGGTFCYDKHNKELGLKWHNGVDSLFKIKCPQCNAAMDSLQVIAKREISNQDAVEYPANVFSIYPWAAILVDRATGERVITIDQPEKKDETNFSLLLTDRRLIYIPPKKQYTYSVKGMIDSFYTVFPLRSIVSVQTAKASGSGTSLTITTTGGQNFTVNSKVPFENFCHHLRQIIKSAPPALDFPNDEQLFLDASFGGNILCPRDYLSTKARDIHTNLFNNSYVISISVTNKRILFYRINHLASAESFISGANAILGAPSLRFISIPWENVLRVDVERSFFGNNINLVLNQPIAGWSSFSLKVPSFDGGRVDPTVQNVVPFYGEADKEWKLPVTTNMYDWEKLIGPAMLNANPDLVVNDSKNKK